MTSPSASASLLVNTQDMVGESPVWCGKTNTLWWTDIDAQRLHALSWDTQQIQTWPLDEPAGCIALHAQGGLIAAMTSGIFRLLPRSDGRFDHQLLHQARHPQDNMRFNDGRTDRQGRFWSTTMVQNMGLAKAAGQLYVTQNNRTRLVLEGFITPNGSAFSPDGKTFYLSDSHASVQKVWKFALHEDGTLGDRRLFIDMNDYPGRPDGATVDEDGCYWICGNDAGQVHRFTPAGQLDRSITVPVDKPAMCTFAGPQLDTLVITSIRPQNVPQGQKKLAGAVFAICPGVKGLADTPYMS